MSTSAALEPVRTIPDDVPAETETLGWAVLEWCSRYLLQPDGPDAGRPWQFTSEQVRIVLRWYALNRDGSFRYRQGTVRRLKGWGKDPFLAALAACEFVGPCRFGGWDSDGRPIAVPHNAAWVQICAVSKDQTRNTMRLFPGLFSGQCLNDYGIDLGKEVIYSRSGGVIEAVTSSPRALEGGRATFVVMNETHHWVASNGGLEMAMTIAGNVGKSRGGGARTMEITNAPQPGENSVAEQTWHTWQKIQEGRQRDPGIYYDSVESPPVDMSDPEQLAAGIRAARGDAHWLDVDWILSTIYSGTMTRERSQRMYLNQLVTAEDQLISPDEWRACVDETLELRTSDEIVLGFDGGRASDATALVAIRVPDRAVFPIAVWERPDGPEADGWEIDRESVDGVVRHILTTHSVQAFFADVSYWESYVDSWSEDFGSKMLVRASSRSAIGRDMRGGLRELTQANERLVSAISDGKIRHPGEQTTAGRALTRHTLNARRRPNQYGLSFGKASRESARKVDAYAAMLLADLARHRLIESGRRAKSGHSGVVYFL